MSLMKRLILSAVLGGAVALPVLPAMAASSAASTSSAGSSASVGSASDSIQASSNSSAGTKVAEGPYRVIDVALAPDAAGRRQVRLAAVQGEQGFVLLLPEATALHVQLVAGDIVQVRERGYGLQFARADAREPFFLVLDDARWRELQSRPVTL
jgi:hypothetical protein